MPVSSTLSTSTLQPSSLNKIALSAENLLDTIKNEQQKSLMDTNTFFKPSNVPDLPPRPGMATLINNSDNLSKSKTKKTLPMTNKLALNNKYNQLLNNKSSISNQLYQPNTHPVNDTLNANRTDTLTRTIPNPTPIKPSEDNRMHLLTLNPREFFKYRYEKLGSSHENVDQINDLNNFKPYSGLLYIHLLAGRGLRNQNDSASTYRDLYCVIECDRQHKARTVVRSGESSFDWDE